MIFGILWQQFSFPWIFLTYFFKFQIFKALRPDFDRSYQFFHSTGCSGKIVFFTIHCNPTLAFIAVRVRQSSHRNASVESLLLAGYFFVQPIAAECWRGRVGKLSRILGKKPQYLMNTTQCIWQPFIGNEIIVEWLYDAMGAIPPRIEDFYWNTHHQQKQPSPGLLIMIYFFSNDHQLINWGFTF